jgi:hypothetical protein
MLNLPDVELVAAKIHDESWDDLSEADKEITRRRVQEVYRAIQKISTRKEMDLSEANRSYRSLSGR